MEEVELLCPIVDSVSASFPAKNRIFATTVFSDTATITSDGTKELPLVPEYICRREELNLESGAIVNERTYTIEQQKYENHSLEVPNKQREFKIVEEKPVNREKVFIEIAQLSRELDWLSLHFYKSEMLLKYVSTRDDTNIPISKYREYIAEHSLRDPMCSYKNNLEYRFLKNIITNAGN
jgi:hypothetical protein